MAHCRPCKRSQTEAPDTQIPIPHVGPTRERNASPILLLSAVSFLRWLSGSRRPPSDLSSPGFPPATMVHIAEIAEGAAEPSKEDNKDATEPLAAAAGTAVEEDTSPHELEQLPLPSQFQEPASLSEQQQPPPLPLLVSSHETPLELAEIAHSPVPEPEPEPEPKPGTATVPPSSSALVDDSQIVAPAPAPPAPVKVPYNEYALRVAYIMRSYLHMRPGGATANATSIASNGESCCRAMMEVTRKDNGRWGVSKVELEHTHQLDPPPDLAGALASGGLVPVLGMEFDSISAAKQYYSAYSEKMGFQSKTGSGKRSRGTRLLHMQRFLCSKGHFSTYSNAAESATRKRKRIPNKKAAEKEVKEVKTDCDALGVIQVESSMKKDGMTLEDQRREIHTENASSGSGNDKRKVNDGGKVGKVALVSNPGQSRLLRELGIRVSRYSNEERRNIILKYMQKRSGRQAVDRSLKIPSRQALAERRQRGVGGKFLSKEETQTMSRQEEILDDEPELPAEVVANAGGVPIVGMLFENEDKAYDYYIKYAGSVGFSVRKGWWDKSARNVTRSRVYVCSREGFRPKNEARRPRAETRTGCPARMAIKLTSSGKYRITEFVADHNHQLAAPLDMQMLSSKKLTLRAETLGGYLKEHLNLENDLRSFLNIYELLLERRRYNELQADYNANQGHPRIPPLRLLWQAANAYTPAIYDYFRREVELFLESMVYCSGEAGILSHYEVTVKEKSKVHCVRFDASNSSVICSCGKFEVVGIPCCHVLKVFDFRNIKELPSQYILKRWRKDAMAENLNENHSITLDSDAKSSVSKRYSSLCRTLFKLAARATENEEAFTLMVSHSDQLLDQVEQILQAKLLEKPSISGTSKGHPNNLIDSGNSSHGTGNDPQKPSGKKKSNGGTRQRHQNEVELNKRQKTRKGQTDDAEMSTRDNEAHAPPSSVSQPRNPANQFLVSNQFMQGPFMTSHQFGVGAMQGYHPVNQFGQDSSAPTLSQQPFPNSSHFTQGFPTPDLQALQFIGNNAQLDHQSSDQGQCAIPVWDFL
ncbi:hypothetical protein ZIOFF_020448 [Zingiber officinale]|uniref:SWIM-type domain-containing protein n=1 Tax=Zingiber officinale TaxID=94328 RepID=A0A8J5LLB5_ZINOF|nr:hypothetical protein ZIOFF_020448 [Zingiber officinale]